MALWHPAAATSYSLGASVPFPSPCLGPFGCCCPHVPPAGGGPAPPEPPLLQQCGWRCWDVVAGGDRTRPCGHTEVPISSRTPGEGGQAGCSLQAPFPGPRPHISPRLTFFLLTKIIFSCLSSTKLELRGVPGERGPYPVQARGCGVLGAVTAGQCPRAATPELFPSNKTMPRAGEHPGSAVLNSISKQKKNKLFI